MPKFQKLWRSRARRALEHVRMLREKATPEISIIKKKFRPKHVRELVELLQNQRELRELVLDSNELGDEGALVLASLLPRCPGLVLLSLRRNRIGNDGAVALAQAISTSRWLQTLDLSENDIGDVGATALRDALVSNRSLREVNVSQCSVSQPLREALDRLTKANTDALRLRQQRRTTRSD